MLPERRRGARKAARRRRGPLRLGLVFAALVGVNVYVFFFSDTSIRKVAETVPMRQLGVSMATGVAGGERLAGSAAQARQGRQRRNRVDGTVGADEGLGAILRRAGVRPPESDEVIRALQPLMSFRKDIRAGQRYSVRMDGAGGLTSFELRVTPAQAYLVERGADGRLSARRTGAGSGESSEALNNRR